MLSVFKYEKDLKHYSSLEFVNEPDFSFLRKVSAGEIDIGNVSVFPEFHVQRSLTGYHVSERNTLPFGDTAGLIVGYMILSQRACNVLRPVLQESGVFIPLVCDEDVFSLFHVTNVIDVLDREQSDLDCFPDGRIIKYRKIAFRSEKLANQILFKIPQKKSYIFVTNLFMEKLNEFGLTGFECPQVWPPLDDTAERRKYLLKRQRKKKTGPKSNS